MKMDIKWIPALLTTLMMAPPLMARNRNPIKGTIPTTTDSKVQLVKLAKLSHQEAAEAALKHIPGKVVESELDEEDGYVVYTFEIVGDTGVRTDVIIDAGTGDLLRQKVDH